MISEGRCPRCNGILYRLDRYLYCPRESPEQLGGWVIRDEASAFAPSDTAPVKPPAPAVGKGRRGQGQS